MRALRDKGESLANSTRRCNRHGEPPDYLRIIDRRNLNIGWSLVHLSIDYTEDKIVPFVRRVVVAAIGKW